MQVESGFAGQGGLAIRGGAGIPGCVIQTIFLDAAGTLIELAEPVATVYARHFAAAGWETAEEDVKAAFHHAFTSTEPPAPGISGDGDAAEQAWWRVVVGKTAAACGIDPKDPRFGPVFDDLFAYYDRGSAWRVYPEVIPFLEKLWTAGFNLAVVSNFDLRLHHILAEVGLAEYFTEIITSAEARSRKPDPGIFHHAFDRLGIGPMNAVHIGDSESADAAGAAAVGMASYILDRPLTTLDDALIWLETKKQSK